MTTQLEELRDELRRFVAERDWGQFHDLKNLAMAMASEAGELLAEFRWVPGHDADNLLAVPATRAKVENEVGDVAIALLLFCDRAGIDLLGAARRKLAVNAANYPVATSKGRAERPLPEDRSNPFSKVIAIDWSGVVSGGHDTIWLAEVTDGELTALENGRSRDEVVDRVIEIARADPNLVVGLDFAFGFPSWFARDHRVESIPDLWRLVASEGETWLRDCRPPFWGRPGMKKPTLSTHFRETELTVGRRVGGQPKSIFQIGGAGAVGTGSLRGMPQLLRLHEAGFSIWPFDPPSRPLVVEIYPRLLTGPVVKSDPRSRIEYLAEKYPLLPAELRDRAASTEDAFDAVVSALVMAAHSRELSALSSSSAQLSLLEGEIWAPAQG